MHCDTRMSGGLAHRVYLMGILHDAYVYVLCCPMFSHMDCVGISISLMSQLADLGSCFYLFIWVSWVSFCIFHGVCAWLACLSFVFAVLLDSGDSKNLLLLLIPAVGAGSVCHVSGHGPTTLPHQSWNATPTRAAIS